MEHGPNSNIPITYQDVNQTIDSSSLEDITIRRMKNRERQRRYRARKRLEADTMNQITYSPLKPYESNATNMQMLVPITQELHHASDNGMKVSAEGQLVLARIESPEDETTANVVTQVHCLRDWKRDARRAHSNEKYNGNVNLEITSVGGRQIQSLSSVTKNDRSLGANVQFNASVSESGEMQKIGPGRRHWKAEARNRKS